MNKLLTKIVGVALGATMAVGVGVGVAVNNSRGVVDSEVRATDPTTTLTSSNGAAAWSDGGGTYLDVVLSNDGGANSPKFSESTDIRLYNKNYITVSAKSAYSSSLTISAVTVNGKGSHNTNTQTLNYKADGTLVKSGASTITFPQKTAKSYDLSFSNVTSFNLYQSGSNNVQITSMVITYSIATAGQKFDITTTVTNGTYTGDNQIEENKSASVTIAPNNGYKLPSSVTVSNNVTSSYNSSTGVISLSNPSGDVTISAAMDAATQYSISYSLTRLTASPSPTTMYENEEVSITLSVTDSTNYTLPSSITVTNSSGYGYNSSTGVITLHGAQDNVTITAAAIAKPAEASEKFDFTDSGLWTGSEKNDKDKYTVYTRKVDLITMTWETNGQSSLAGAYWNPARIYVGHKVTISALTGQGAVTTIKSVTFHTVKNGTSSTTSGTNNATRTVTQPTTGAGTIASSVSDQDVTYTITGTVTEFTLVVSGSQSRWSTVDVVYMKDQSEVALQSISATCAGVLVSQQVSPIITFNPAGATNKNVTYQIVEGTSSLASVSESGVVTGLGAGTARLKITPEDTNASAITIDVVITALPSIYGVEVGKKYAATSSGYELTGINVGNYGESTSYSGSTSNSFPIRVVNGLYTHTVALEVTIDENTKYLSWDSEANINSLNYVDSIDRSSSWIFAEVSSELQVRNVGAYGRILCFYGGTTLRFNCYPEATATSDNCHALSFVEIIEQKTDKEYVQDFVDLYMHMADYTEEKDWCKDGQHGYYLTAKAGYNSIIHGVAARETLWNNDSDFATAKLRYEAWARANNDSAPYDGYDDVHSPLTAPNNLQVDTNNTTVVATVIVISVLSMTTLFGYFLLRKRKEER